MSPAAGTLPGKSARKCRRNSRVKSVLRTLPVLKGTLLLWGVSVAVSGVSGSAKDCSFPLRTLVGLDPSSSLRRLLVQGFRYSVQCVHLLISREGLLRAVV